MEFAKNRWVQLVLGILCMMMIANLQYGWTLFVLPIDQAFHWGKKDIQVAFTLFVLFETWPVPIEGWLIDRFGPRPMGLIGGTLIGGSWIAMSQADSLMQLYVAAAFGGFGAGIIYGITVGNATKWFTNRRGLATGLTAAGFGAGSALTVVPIANWIETHGYQSAFFWVGLIQGIAVLAIALLLARPNPDPDLAVLRQPLRPGEMTPGQVLKTPIFWVMYVMFVLVGAGGLMATAQLSVIANDYGVAKNPVDLLGISLPALTFALSIDRILNGITRPFFGWVSDRIGRENTMFIAFTLEGIGIWMLMSFGQDPVMFVVLSGLVFFAWGEIYSLFPATCGDAFGRHYATANYGMLYTAKGTAALIVPLSSQIKEMTGSWSGIFVAAIAANFLAALLALFVLKRLRRPSAQHAMAQPA